jgi:myosin heavy subunit
VKQGVTKRAGRKKDRGGEADFATAGGADKKNQKVRKAVFETTKKKEVGVSDLTLISKITNEAINENLKKRFDNREIYVRRTPSDRNPLLPPNTTTTHRLLALVGTD